MEQGRWGGVLARIAIHTRSGFWFVPALLTVAAIALALGLVELDQRASPGAWPRMFAAEAEGSRAMLSAIASSMITVAGVVFSITIVALAQAATQYTSRVLRNFMRDRMNQVVLGVFVGAFTYCLVVLRTIRGGETPFVPSLAVFAGLVLALVAMGFLIVFIHHIATSIQAAEIVRAVTMETRIAMDRLHADAMRRQAPPGARIEVPDGPWQPLPAAHTGYIQTVGADALVAFAAHHDAVLRMGAGVGEFVAEGRPIAHARAARPLDAQAVAALNALYVVGAFRTTDQDPAFGFRQLVDIALKALSPGINDSTTAGTCLDHLSVLLQHVALRGDEPSVWLHDGLPRVVARTHGFAELAELSFGQVLENAEGNTVVLLRMLDCVREVAGTTADAAHHRVLAGWLEAMDEAWQRTVPSPHARARLAAAAASARAACARVDEAAPG